MDPDRGVLAAVATRAPRQAAADAISNAQPGAVKRNTVQLIGEPPSRAGATDAFEPFAQRLRHGFCLGFAGQFR